MIHSPKRHLKLDLQLGITECRRRRKNLNSFWKKGDNGESDDLKPKMQDCASRKILKKTIRRSNQ